VPSNAIIVASILARSAISKPTKAWVFWNKQRTHSENQTHHV
jgi:hypothetical protein